VWREDYQRDGFVVLPGLLDPATTTSALEHLARYQAEHDLPADAGLVAVPLSEADAQLAGHERLIAAATALLDEPADPFGFTYLCKPARTGLPALWHQDGAPWAPRLAGAAALTMWVALDDADSLNGCLRVIPGSHGLDAQPLRPDAHTPSLFGVGMDPVLVDEGRAIEVPLRCGDVSAHHPNLVHSSGPNRSDRPRRAVAIRYRGRSARP